MRWLLKIILRKFENGISNSISAGLLVNFPIEKAISCKL